MSAKPTRLRLYSRSGCHLCEQMREEIEGLLSDLPLEWEVLDVDRDPELARRYGEFVPVLFVNGRFFARGRLPRLALGLRLRRAAARPD